MRLPKAQRKKQESLNSAYAFVASQSSMMPRPL